MVSALDSGSSGLGSSLDQHTALCSWSRHFTLIVTLSIKLDIGELMLGVTLLWTSIPMISCSRREKKCYRNWDKLRSNWPPNILYRASFILFSQLRV